MKKFQIITEVDARLLTPGETVTLTRRGHITPLAQDTLRDRRIVVLTEDGVSPDDASLDPRAEIRSVAIGSDHGGVALRRLLVGFLRGRGLAVIEIGGDAATLADYPDIAASVARPVARGEVDAGIVIDGAGIGSAIAANKIDGVRAVMATTETIARYARAHCGANVLTLGATLLSDDEARAIVATWLITPMREPRYIRRLAKIRDLERHG